MASRERLMPLLLWVASFSSGVFDEVGEKKLHVRICILSGIFIARLRNYVNLECWPHN
jgi:hypothetical protein